MRKNIVGKAFNNVNLLILNGLKSLLRKHSFKFGKSNKIDFALSNSLFDCLVKNQPDFRFKLYNYAIFYFTRDFFSMESISRSSSVLSLSRHNNKQIFFNFV
jgi:hypothetical protein